MENKIPERFLAHPVISHNTCLIYPGVHEHYKCGKHFGSEQTH